MALFQKIDTPQEFRAVLTVLTLLVIGLTIYNNYLSIQVHKMNLENLKAEKNK
jgi:hypothetical protein